MKETTTTIDNGNSHPHVGFFSNGTLEKVMPLSQVKDFSNVNRIIISSVGKNLPFEIEKTALSLEHLWENNSFAQMPCLYDKNQIGRDRLYQAAYLYSLEQYPCILIDAGTFITVDYISNDGLEGGFIIPGLKNYLNLYSQNGANLPNIEKDQFISSDKLPKNTQEAIGSTVLFSLEKCIEKIPAKNCQIILTGGDSELLKKYFQDALIEPHLIHKSLYFLSLR